MMIFIPEIENMSAFPDNVLADLFAWAEEHAITLYCDKPVRFQEDTEVSVELFEGFADFCGDMTLAMISSNPISGSTPVYCRDPDCLEHRYFVGDYE